MKILLTGASGLLGTALRSKLTQDGHTVVPFKFPHDSDALRSPATATQLSAALADTDGMIHLSGKNVATRWTDKNKELIRQSRITTTQIAAACLTKNNAKNKFFVHASATGIYGTHASLDVTENSPAGSGFLAEVCRDWEAACAVAAEAGTRVVHLRFGPVLSRDGGMLKALLPVFRLGLGGPIGEGQRWLSWIHITDAVQILADAAANKDWSGPINVVSPYAITNAEFTKSLAKALHRPALFPLPPPVLIALLGEMAKETILSDLRVKPAVLLERGFRYQFPDCPRALNQLLNL